MLLSTAFSISIFAISISKADEWPTVETPRGNLTGGYEISRNGNRFESYLGIRYGVVHHRFEPSVMSESWEGLKEARTPGPHCAQISFGGDPFTGVENCLYLNVFTPKSDGKKRAVLVYIHGGGFVFGSPLEYGGDFLVDEDLVVVTLSYRLGILGFLNTQDGTVSGNNGLKDQVLALQWVQENIEAFGGDKNRITISGNSAGGASVLYLMISPMAQGLFHGAYVQSGSPLNPWGFTADPRSTLLHVVTQMDCVMLDNLALVECLRLAPLDKLIQAQMSPKTWAFDLFRVSPSTETPNARFPSFLPASPDELMKEGKFNSVPLLFTAVQDEGSLNFGSIVIRRADALKEMNDNASTVDPHAFRFQHNGIPNVHYEEASRRIRSFYFGRQIIDENDEQGLVDLFGDTLFYRGFLQSIKLLSFHIPIYFGHFTHKRRDDFSPVATFGIHERINSVTHCEDLSYIFKSTGRPNPFPYIGELSHTKDIQFSKEFVQLLASFVKTGTPTVSFGNRPSWIPVSKEDIKENNWQFLNLGESPHYHTPPFVQRMTFWDELEKELQGEQRKLEL